MGRIRTLKPEFFRSRSLAKCSIPARLTFEGLWTEADDYGRGIADARVLAGALWPLDDDIGHEDVARHLDELETTGHIERYEIDGETYYAVTAWEDHQAARYRRGRGFYPGPDGTIPDQTPAQSWADSDPKGRRNMERGTRNLDQGRDGPTRAKELSDALTKCAECGLLDVDCLGHDAEETP